MGTLWTALGKIGAAGGTGLSAGQMAAVGLGSAGVNYYGNRKANQAAFRDRMRAAEEYGIHPLQALGGAGTFGGQGGLNVGSQMMNARDKAVAEQRMGETHDAQIRQTDAQTDKAIAEAGQARSHANYLDFQSRDPEPLDLAIQNHSGSAEENYEQIIEAIVGNPALMRGIQNATQRQQTGSPKGGGQMNRRQKGRL